MVPMTYLFYTKSKDGKVTITKNCNLKFAKELHKFYSKNHFANNDLKRWGWLEDNDLLSTLLLKKKASK